MGQFPITAAGTLLRAQPYRGPSDVPSCDEVAFKGLAVQIDFVLAGDLFWRSVLVLRWVYPYLAIGDALALPVWNAPITKDVNVGPLPLSEITTSRRAGWKIHSEKQNELSLRSSAINLGQKYSNTVAIHFKVAGVSGH